MNNRLSFRTRFYLAVLLPIFMIFFVLLNPMLSEKKLDNSILVLIVLAILIIILPWERIKYLKAGNFVEIGLVDARIDRAIEVVENQYENVSDEKLRAILKHLKPQIAQAEGSRILWIDNSPYNVLGERRLFRALGIEIVMAESSKTAREYMLRDGDFDLIISDMRRKELHPPDAVQFIREVRESENERQKAGNYSHIQPIQVVFYSGIDKHQLYSLTQEVQILEPSPILASGVGELIQHVLQISGGIRLEPISVIQNPKGA